MCRKNRIILLRMNLCLFPFSRSCRANLNPVVPMAGIMSCLRRGVVTFDRSRLERYFQMFRGLGLNLSKDTSVATSGSIFIHPVHVYFTCREVIQNLPNLAAEINTRGSDAVITEIQYYCTIDVLFVEV